ncbi:MAG: NAD(P)-dependent oxidoreductase, partial [Bacteroidota bacterium]
MKKLLVTGGFGKIGKHFVQQYDHKYEITVADVLTNEGSFTDGVRIEKADLTDATVCRKLCEGMDTIIHLAGLVDLSEADEVLNTNIRITQHIFKAAVKAGCRRLIFASSAQT